MFWYTVVFAFFTLFTVGSVAQALGDKPTGPAQNNADHHAQTRKPVWSRGAPDARISIVRLREPAKARQLYEKATNAWMKQKPAEAQHRLEQALKIYPFPKLLLFTEESKPLFGSGDRQRRA